MNIPIVVVWVTVTPHILAKGNNANLRCIVTTNYVQFALAKIQYIVATICAPGFFRWVEFAEHLGRVTNGKRYQDARC